MLQACELADGQLWGPWVAESAGEGAGALPGRIASKVSGGSTGFVCALIRLLHAWEQKPCAV